MHPEEIERFPLTWESRAGSCWHMTVFRLASIKYLCVRLRSRSSFFSKASWDADKLSTYFIMTSDIMELTSTISGRVSASGVRHLREDNLITALWSKSGPGHGVWRAKFKFCYVSPMMFAPKRTWARWTSSIALHRRPLKRHLESLGRRGSSTVLFAARLVGKGYRLHRKLLPVSGWAGGVCVSLCNWLFSKTTPTHWPVKQRMISII